MSSTEILERAAKRKKTRGSRAESPVAAPVPKPLPRKKDLEGAKAKGRHLSLPEDFLAGEGVDDEMWPAAESLLFPAALHRLQTLPIERVADYGVGHAIQALQHFMVLRLHSNSALKELVQQVETSSLENKELKEKLKKLEEIRAEEAKAAIAKQEELEGQIMAQKEEMLDLEAVGEVRGKAKFGWEVYTSKDDFATVKKTAQAAVDFYLENVGNMSDLQMVEGDTHATASTADSGLGDDEPTAKAVPTASPAPST